MTATSCKLDSEAHRGDLAAYALGSLPEAEATRLEGHLDSCPRCRELLVWLSPAVNVLPSVVPQKTPPPELRERLMATVRAEAEADLAPAPSRPQWWNPFGAVALRPAMGFAAAAVLAIGIAGGYAVRGGGDPASPEPAFVEAKALSGNPNVSATLERAGDSATLHVNELPKLPANKVYEVWLERAGVMEPSTLFVLDRSGSAVAAIPGPLEGVERVLVTAEPRGGSSSPTGPPLLAAAIQ